MSLKLYYHPLASACWKVLIALYENDTPFQAQLVDLADPSARADFAKLWPLAKFPVLHDQTRDRVVPETSIIIEYLAQYYPGKVALIPADSEAAWRARLRDRFFDFYVHDAMQRIVADRLRPEGKHDPYGVDQAKALLTTAYAIIERDVAANISTMGDTFTIADCAACPALYYANLVAPIGDSFPQTQAYLRRLEQRPSFARVLKEAQPYFEMFPS